MGSRAGRFRPARGHRYVGVWLVVFFVSAFVFVICTRHVFVSYRVARRSELKLARDNSSRLSCRRRYGRSLFVLTYVCDSTNRVQRG